LGIKKGDIVFFDRLCVEKYNFFGKNYLIIKEKRIHGIL
jgi:co-chaperonin GroES (HSP10)